MLQKISRYLLLFTLLLTPQIHGTNSYFSTSQVLAGSVFSTGYWTTATALHSTITYPHDDSRDLDHDNGKNEAKNPDNQILKLFKWNGHIKGTATDNLSGVDHVEVSIHREILDLYWDGSDWVKGSENSTRVIATGTANWSYQFKNRPAFGIFKIISHAVDKAGNIENSATVIFENSDVPVFDFDLSSDTLLHKITLSVVNQVDEKLNYEIQYLDKGIAGKFGKSESVREFFLGSCSAGGTCTPDPLDVGSTISVTIGSLSKIFIY
jgi:hypothetical protein